MTITLNLPEEVQKTLERLAAAEGCPDVSAYVQKLVIKESDQAKAEFVQEFKKLAEQWRTETKYLSFGRLMAEHPAYRAIVAMGKKAVPLILAELERRPGHWFQALREITGASPVPAESQGDIKQMSAEWIRWGRDQGYRW